jgi:glyoxylase-like metal-dependent hydrolase (beta-lactamase superfamily II)
LSVTDESVEVLKNVWQVRQDLAPVQPGTYSVAQLLVGDQILLIDTGIPGRDGSILGLIQRLGRSPRDVVAILNTHGHADHIGSNVVLADTTGAPVHIHRDDRFYLDAAKQYWGDFQVKTAPAQVLLADGDILTFGEHRLTVIHLPGHSAGSVGYYDTERRILYCGDAVQGRGSAVQHLALYYDPSAYERSLRRVRSLDIEHLIPSHPYLPLSASIVSGEAVLDYLDLSLRVYQELDDQIREVTRKAARPVTVEEIALPLCLRNGFETITSMATTTVRAHLERMRRGRTATMKNVGGSLVWDVE